jgi:D-psicose/D-tagatose/L-ribulose 3-epimerase
MKLAISNIAWSPEEDEDVCSIMLAHGISGMEFAPTKIWPNPLQASDSEIIAYKRFWADHNIEIPSMQALLYGRPDLTIFQIPEKRRETVTYLGKIIRMAGLLGASVLVFGSPKNRLTGNMPEGDIESIAVEFFRELGCIAQQHETVFCIEPNPTAYGCDFVNTSSQGLALVAKVDHPGFGLHLDAAGMTMSGEDIEAALRQTAGRVCHFHISEPNLDTIGSGGVDHSLFSRTLADTGYRNWYSIEMRPPNPPDNLPGITKALQNVRNYYFG